MVYPPIGIFCERLEHVHWNGVPGWETWVGGVKTSVTHQPDTVCGRTFSSEPKISLFSHLNGILLRLQLNSRFGITVV